MLSLPRENGIARLPGLKLNLAMSIHNYMKCPVIWLLIRIIFGATTSRFFCKKK